MDYLLKNKKLYLMVAGTVLPGIALHTIARALKASQSVQNIAGFAGLVFGGILTSKMLK